MPLRPTGAPSPRAPGVRPAIARGVVILPCDPSVSNDLIDSCATFPNCIHDDDVDAMSQALNRMIYVDVDAGVPTVEKVSTWSEDMLADYNNASPRLNLDLLKMWGRPRTYDV